MIVVGDRIHLPEKFCVWQNMGNPSLAMTASSDSSGYNCVVTCRTSSYCEAVCVLGRANLALLSILEDVNDNKSFLTLRCSENLFL